MPLDKLKRVMQELEQYRDKNTGLVTHTQIEKSIMKICGFSTRTVRENRQQLQKLEWIKRINRWQYELGEEYKIDESNFF